MAESTVDEMVKRGVIPAPIRLSTGCVRWCWAEVDAALKARKDGGAATPADPYLAGARNVAQIAEKRRGTA
jgi:hypothetical protein